MLPPFPGLRDEAFQFLRDLRDNNEREWFKPRKDTYEDEIAWPIHCLVAEASERARAEGLPLAGEPKKALFRIYRDTRFSNDKRPYKTHAGVVFNRDARKGTPGGLYLHVAPGECFLTAGYWRPGNDLLRPWRARMAANPAEWEGVVAQLAKAGLTLEHPETLKRMPRGYEAHAGTDLEAALKAKAFLVTRPYPDTALQTPAFTDEVLRMMRDSLPLLEYGWAVEAG